MVDDPWLDHPLHQRDISREGRPVSVLYALLLVELKELLKYRIDLLDGAYSLRPFMSFAIFQDLHDAFNLLLDKRWEHTGLLHAGCGCSALPILFGKDATLACLLLS